MTTFNVWRWVSHMLASCLLCVLFVVSPLHAEGRISPEVQPSTSNGHHGLRMLHRDVSVMKGDHWLPDTFTRGLPKEPPIRIFPRPDGSTWLMFADNRLSVVRPSGHIKNYTSHEGLDIGAALAMSFGQRCTWVAGTRGVACLRNGRFTTLHAANSMSFRDADGLVLDRSGNLWVNALAGLFRIDKNQLAEFLDQPRYKVKATFFDESAGQQQEHTMDDRRGPSLVLSGGRLWVVRPQGMSWINPRRIHRNTMAPVVEVMSVAADGVLHGPQSPLKLPPLTHAVRFVYTAASTSRPDSLNFRFRVVGFDRGWITVGDRMATTYTNLAPGAYVFEVEAENANGVWSTSPATVAFSIAPALYQTWWFRAASVLFVLLLAWLLYAWRLSLAQTHLQLQLEAVHNERERIARELHDTLMQSAHGLVLQIRSWADDRRDTADLKSEMSRAADVAGDMVIEGRNRILALRAPICTDAGISDCIKSTAEECLAFGDTEFYVHQRGRPRCVRPDMAEQLVGICLEAIRNATLHARAARIVVIVTYTRRYLDIVIHDNGVGMPYEVLQQGHRAGHWGLIGMRERARVIGARLHIARAEGGGTHVQARLPINRSCSPMQVSIRPVGLGMHRTADADSSAAGANAARTIPRYADGSMVAHPLKDISETVE
ncbi:sensor histidine kinase [Dyella sp. A6]|uniref:sensor histidine kinase n=1 Tax=Dyella aluminiiresistens TaxID=3069105 RepID=UPI002E76499F|nr:triple tyrosine motif-containing protein [Dyella sp. A6]